MPGQTIGQLILQCQPLCGLGRAVKPSGRGVCGGCDLLDVCGDRSTAFLPQLVCGSGGTVQAACGGIGLGLYLADTGDKGVDFLGGHAKVGFDPQRKLEGFAGQVSILFE